jgi:hypothetical protein
MRTNKTLLRHYIAPRSPYRVVQGVHGDEAWLLQRAAEGSVWARDFIRDRGIADAVVNRRVLLEQRLARERGVQVVVDETVPHNYYETDYTFWYARSLVE